MQDLLLLLQGLEVELHHPGTRCSPARLDALLHPQFHEIGRSGRAYDRETVLGSLAFQNEHPRQHEAPQVVWLCATHDFSPILKAMDAALPFSLQIS